MDRVGDTLVLNAGALRDGGYVVVEDDGATLSRRAAPRARPDELTALAVALRAVTLDAAGTLSRSPSRSARPTPASPGGTGCACSPAKVERGIPARVRRRRRRWPFPGPARRAWTTRARLVVRHRAPGARARRRADAPSTPASRSCSRTTPARPPGASFPRSARVLATSGRAASAWPWCRTSTAGSARCSTASACAPLVDAVVHSSRAGSAKPDPGIFSAALARLDVAPGEALHVGDEPVEDVLGARSAGLRAVLIDRAGRVPALPAGVRGAAVARSRPATRRRSGEGGLSCCHAPGAADR